MDQRGGDSQKGAGRQHCEMGPFDKHVTRYDRWYDKNPFAYQSELAAIRAVLPKTGKGLEIGVGTGRFAGPSGIQHGVDPSPGMLGIAQKRGVLVKQSPGEKLPFRNQFFDYVLLVNTLCFVERVGEVLKETRRVLKKGGNIVVGFIDRESFLGREYQKRRNIFYKQAKFFTPAEVANFLQAAGYVRLSFSQAVFKLPDKMGAVEKPQKGYGQGGFVVVRGAKPRKEQAR